MKRPTAPDGLSAAQREELGRRLRERQRALRADVAAKLKTQDDPRLVGLRNQMEDTDDWAVADATAARDIALVARDLAELSQVEQLCLIVLVKGRDPAIQCYAFHDFKSFFLASR